MFRKHSKNLIVNYALIIALMDKPQINVQKRLKTLYQKIFKKDNFKKRPLQI